MKTTKILILLLGILFTSSCSDVLDTKPLSALTSESYLTNSTSNMNNGLNAVYDILGKNELYSDTYISYSDINADEGFCSANITAPYFVGYYNYSSSETQIYNLWRILYKGVERSNVLLAAINKADTTVIKTVDLNKIKGEALFLRAYYYYLLVQNWGDVPLVLSTATQSIENIRVPRDSTIKVYRQILSDMKTAEGLVSSISKYASTNGTAGGGRVSKSAVRGILARVCLSMAGYPLNLGTPMYEEAKSWAEKVITVPEGDYIHSLLPNYRDVFINYQKDNGYDTRESIWEVEFLNNGNTVYSEGGRIGLTIGNGQTYSGASSPSTKVNMTKYLWDLYEATDTIRSRWNRWCYKFNYEKDSKGNIISTSYLPGDVTSYALWNSNCGKYRRDYETRSNGYSTSINFPLLRYADVLLMYAEAENEINPNSASAYAALNEVRQRAYGKLLPVPADSTVIDLPNPAKYPQYTDDQEGLRLAIQDERSRELCFEGLRKQDLVRWGIFISRLETVADKLASDGVGGFAQRVYPNVREKHTFYPIPAKEILVNGKLTQNVGW